MRALVNTPEHPDPVEMREIATPEPGLGEILIHVSAFSLNRGELNLLKARPEGWRPGQDVAGVVAAVPEGCKSVSVGARVVALLDGAGWAECTAVPLHRLAVLPDDVSFEQAAALPVAGLTALRTLRFGGSLLGQRVLVSGAAGGVGHLAVQLAARAGARVTAVARPDHADAVRALGAKAVVGSLDAARGAFRLVLESAGEASLKAAIRHVEAGGTVVVYGNSNGEPTLFSFEDFGGAQNARVQTFFSFSSEVEEAFAPDLALLAGLVADGTLKPHLGEVHSWCELASGAARLAARRTMGKLVFRVD